MVLPQLLVAASTVKSGAKGIQKTSELATEKLGYDFLGLAVRLVLFFSVAYLIQIYVQSKMTVEEWIRNPALIVTDLGGIGLFGVSGLVFNFLWQQFNPNQETNVPEIPPKASDFWNNKSLKELFSPDGFHGLHYWDIIKIVSIVLVFMEWQRFKKSQKQMEAKVSPITHALFLGAIILLGLWTVPDLLKKLKSLNFNKEIDA